ncbi:AzlD domain-containing protein [Rodentibacter pneumotropicus]|uniref:AzlD domain-containing protein n=1 Tax=Rodentibacter pneumotropicus TaxID=758 RepID=UPI00109D1AAF|nr:branched-chain amino acid ABC transporter [Rodentibacter pneumotropicus]
MTNILFLILFSAITIFIFRISPFFLKDNKHLNNKDGFIYKSIRYSAQAMIGIIVFNSAFSGKDIVSIFNDFSPKTIIILFLLLGTFIMTIVTKKIIPSFIITLTLYSLILYYFPM